MKKHFPALKIISLNEKIAVSAPLCKCDLDYLPKCSCDSFIFDYLRRCDCDPDCSCDSFKMCTCDLKPLCPCDLDICMRHCTCHSKKSLCSVDYVSLPKVPIESSLPLGCQMDGASGSKLVKISKTTINSCGDVSSKIVFRNRETLEVIEKEDNVH